MCLRYARRRPARVRVHVLVREWRGAEGRGGHRDPGGQGHRDQQGEMEADVVGHQADDRRARGHAGVAEADNPGQAGAGAERVGAAARPVSEVEGYQQ